MKRDDTSIVGELHPLDDMHDSLSPKLRQGRHIAVRQERTKAVLLKFTVEEHDTLRRVANYLGYSLSQTVRLVMKERELSIWPDGEFPFVYELDADKRKAKIDAQNRTKNWTQRRANAAQAKEARIRKDIQRLEEISLKKEAQKTALLQELSSIEEVRAKKRAATKSLYREIDRNQLNARETLKEIGTDVEIELVRETERLGRKLTESEKLAVGTAVRAFKGSPADLELESAIDRAILDAERKTSPRRKLTVREQWDIRVSVRLKKHPRRLLHKR